MKAELIKTDGEITEVAPKNGKTFTLGELSGYVGGYIEVVYLHNGDLMVINEEGKLLAMSENETATKLFRKLRVTDDYIAGNALVMPPEMMK